MNEVISAGRTITQAAMDRVYPNRWRLLVVLVIFSMVAATDGTRELAVQSMSDAFLTVSVFVAATLALVFYVEKAFSFDLGVQMAKHRKLQPLIASALGILPGCGGAIVVVTQFTRGYASFGAFIAVLVSTMGDAAFLLLAREPGTALLVLSISMVAGTVTGIIVDMVHGSGYLALNRDDTPPEDIIVSSHEHTTRLNSAQALWAVMITIGLVFGFMIAFQAEPDQMLGSWIGFVDHEPVKWFGFVGAVLSLLMWATVRDGHSTVGADTMPTDPIPLRVIFDTNFVTSWVVMAFLGYEIAVTYLGLDVQALFGSFTILMPAIAILIGFIPGCGPQIVVTSLYLTGVIPFSALIANAIANDGDALFPALALAPKAAILATLYSAIPAALIGYGFYFWGWG